MTEIETLETLENLVEQLGIQLRYEQGDFVGGTCRVGEVKMLIINRGLQPLQKIAMIARELARADLSAIYILPAVRELIQRYDAASNKVEA